MDLANFQFFMGCLSSEAHLHIVWKITLVSFCNLKFLQHKEKDCLNISIHFAPYYN